MRDPIPCTVCGEDARGEFGAPWVIRDLHDAGFQFYLCKKDADELRPHAQQILHLLAQAAVDPSGVGFAKARVKVVREAIANLDPTTPGPADGTT